MIVTFLKVGLTYISGTVTGCEFCSLEIELCFSTFCIIFVLGNFGERALLRN